MFNAKFQHLVNFGKIFDTEQTLSAVDTLKPSTEKPFSSHGQETLRHWELGPYMTEFQEVTFGYSMHEKAPLHTARDQSGNTYQGGFANYDIKVVPGRNKQQRQSLMILWRKWSQRHTPSWREETEGLVQKHKDIILLEHGIIGEHVPLGHTVEQLASVVEAEVK